MSTHLLKRQFITDALGHPIGVILPLDEFALIKDVLEQRAPLTPKVIDADLLKQMRLAASDPLFLADLRETMEAFAQVDAKWWEVTVGETNCQRMG